MTEADVRGANSMIATAFGPVELHWTVAGKLTAVRLMPRRPTSPYTALPERFQPLAETILGYFNGKTVDFSPYFHLWQTSDATDFRQRVYAEVAGIPYGERRTYASVAQAVGSPRAARAVGTAMGANPIPLIVPCHRVVAADGLGGFSAGCGVDLKRRMLELESRRTR